MDVTRKSARKWIDSLSLRVQQGLFAAATYLILLAICLLAISPEQYDLSVGDVAPKTITASKDIVDEITTERRRQAAADAVSPKDSASACIMRCRWLKSSLISLIRLKAAAAAMPATITSCAVIRKATW